MFGTHILISQSIYFPPSKYIRNYIITYIFTWWEINIEICDNITGDFFAPKYNIYIILYRKKVAA